MVGFWDLSDENKRLYNEHYATVAEECDGCGAWVPIEQIEFGSAPYCENCQKELVCENCGSNISSFEFTQTGLCSNCEYDDYDEYDTMNTMMNHHFSCPK